MANAGFIMTFWIALLAPWVADPGMVILGGVLGYDTAWFSSTTGLFVCATVVNIWGFIIVSMGLRHYNTWQRIIMFAATFCLVVIGIVMTVNSNADFVDSYNAAADEFGSYDYDETIARADQGRAIEELSPIGTPDGIDWAATLALFPAISWGTAYGYQITFICGEVKRPQRNIILGQVLAALIPGIFMMWFAWGLPRLMGTEFVQAAAYFDNGGIDETQAIIDGFALPAGAPSKLGISAAERISSPCCPFWRAIRCCCSSWARCSYCTTSSGCRYPTSPGTGRRSLGAWTGLGQCGSLMSTRGSRQ